MADVCGTCRHFIGGGDWNLCCTEMYDLCYRFTQACDKYEYSAEKMKELDERDRQLAEYIKGLKKR